MVEMLIIQSHRWARWRRVADPADVGGRVTLTSPWHSLLYVLARRASTVERRPRAPAERLHGGLVRPEPAGHATRAVVRATARTAAAGRQAGSGARRDYKRTAPL